MPSSGDDLFSFALLGADGRLHDWSRGFEDEFAPVRELIAAGARLEDLLTAAARADGVERGSATVQGPGAPPTVYWAMGGAVAVTLTRTSAGGVARMACRWAGEARPAAVFQTAEERWFTGACPTAEAVAEFSVDRNGAQTYAPVGEDTRLVWGLGPDVDLSDVPSVLSRVVQSPEQAERFQATLARLIERLDPHFVDVLVRGHDGLLRAIRFAMTATRQEDGATRIVIRMRDVTCERLAENQLELLRSAVEHATDSILLLRQTTAGDGRVLYVNRAFEEMTGWSASEAIAMTGRPVAEPALSSLWREPLAAARRGEARGVEFQTPRRSGDLIWIEASAKLVERRPDGSADWVVVSRNVDERRRAQQDLLAAKDAAEAASRVKSEFLANMSHEIRTPMNGVLGMTAMLLDTDLNDEQRTYARAVEQSGEALLAIINDILDISKLEAGKVELESINFDPAETAESAVALLVPTARAKGLDLTLEIDPCAPSAVRGDPNRLRQILLNLVGNAIKFTARGGVSVRLGAPEAGPGPAGETRVRFAVADTGIGMPPEVCARLFQKFSQADSSISRRYGGTGLGLAISKQLVELMGGRIAVASEVGAGSTFAFEVDFAPPTADALQEAAPGDDATADGDEAEARALRILLAEDHAINRQFALAVLAAGGHSADVAVNGREAVEAVAHGDYDVVLMDVQMPECDGLEATRRIRALASPRSKVRIIALTADAMSGAREQFVAAGMDDYLSKPIKPFELLTKLASVARASDPVHAGSGAGGKAAANGA